MPRLRSACQNAPRKATAQGNLRTHNTKLMALSTAATPSKPASQKGEGDVVLLAIKALVNEPPKAKLVTASAKPIVNISTFPGICGSLISSSRRSTIV